GRRRGASASPLGGATGNRRRGAARRLRPSRRGRTDEPSLRRPGSLHAAQADRWRSGDLRDRPDHPAGRRLLAPLLLAALLCRRGRAVLALLALLPWGGGAARGGELEGPAADRDLVADGVVVHVELPDAVG